MRRRVVALAGPPGGSAKPRLCCSRNPNRRRAIAVASSCWGAQGRGGRSAQSNPAPPQRATDRPRWGGQISSRERAKEARHCRDRQREPGQCRRASWRRCVLALGCAMRCAGEYLSVRGPPARKESGCAGPTPPATMDGQSRAGGGEASKRPPAHSIQLPMYIARLSCSTRPLTAPRPSPAPTSPPPLARLARLAQEDITPWQLLPPPSSRLVPCAPRPAAPLRLPARASRLRSRPPAPAWQPWEAPCTSTACRSRRRRARGRRRRRRGWRALDSARKLCLPAQPPRPHAAPVVCPVAITPAPPPDPTPHNRVVAAGRSRPLRSSVVAQATGDKKFDYDLVIIGCGVGGHGAALHAVESVSDSRAQQQPEACGGKGRRANQHPCLAGDGVRVRRTDSIQPSDPHARGALGLICSMAAGMPGRPSPCHAAIRHALMHSCVHACVAQQQPYTPAIPMCDGDDDEAAGRLHAAWPLAGQGRTCTPTHPPAWAAAEGIEVVAAYGPTHY